MKELLRISKEDMILKNTGAQQNDRNLEEQYRKELQLGNIFKVIFRKLNFH